MIIKAVSLWQPWAWAMWEGLKQWETRHAIAPVVSQLRLYRGPMAIHAAKKRFRFADMEDEFSQQFRKNCPGIDLPDTTAQFEQQIAYGVIGGICWFNGEIVNTHQARVSEVERFWGNYEPWRKAIHCPHMVKLDTPMPVSGSQGLWNWIVPPEYRSIVEQITRNQS